jgi:uncharacterized protein (TIGR03000 family)
MRTRILLGVGAVGLALLLTAEPAHAARFAGGGRGFVAGGRGYYAGGRGYYGGYGRGYYAGYNRGYGRGYYADGYGGWGLGLDLGYPVVGGYGVSPYYYGDGSSYYSMPPADSGPAGGYYGGAQITDDTARVRVMVPEGAKVWFGNQNTTQSGTVRYFESPALTPGQNYTYDVKAQWRDADGKEVTRTRQVDVRANGAVTVDFTR